MKGSITSRGAGRWRLRFDTGRDAQNRRTQHSETFTGTKTEANRRLRELITKYEKGDLIAQRPQTVGEYLDFWLEHDVVTRPSERTRQNYLEYVQFYLKPNLGRIPLADLKPADIQSLWTKLLKGGKRTGEPLSETTVHHCHAVLRNALKRAVLWQLLTTNPADGVSSPRVDVKDPAFLTEEQMVHLMRAAKGTPYYIAILLALTTGIRRGEIAGLRWKDVDLDRAVFSTLQTRVRLTGGKCIFKEPKRASSKRAITLPAFVVDVLRAEWRRQEDMRPIMGVSYNMDGLVVCQPDGRPYNPNSLWKGLQQVLESAGLPPMALHELRHSHASLLLVQGVHIKVVSERLGHSDPAVTMRIYSHVVESLQVEAATLTDSALKRGVEENG